jgi:glycosyltransferase involved in cell wall biosynthesis
MNESTDPTRPLRIVHSESSCGWGGQEIRILAEAAGMIARGHDVSLVCPAEAPICAAARDRGVPVFPLPIEKRNWRAFAAVRDWLRSNGVDVINTHSSTDSWLFALASRTMRRRPGIVRTRHISSDVSRDPLTRWLYGRGADRIVTTGERLRRTLIDRLGLAPEHVVSIPTGIDTSRFTPADSAEARRRLGLPLDRTIIGIVATIRSWKGHLFLIDALAGFPQRARPLVLIVGDGPSRRLVEERIQERGVVGSVQLVGHQEDTAPWLQAMDIFALPSYANEGVPQSIMQAMSCGLPVVSTPVGSIEEAVTHEKTGLLVPPKDFALLREALARLVGDPALRRRLGDQGRRVARASFTFSQMIERMEIVFRQVAVRGGDRVNRVAGSERSDAPASLQFTGASLRSDPATPISTSNSGQSPVRVPAGAP